jgi:hypothetical protein
MKRDDLGRLHHIRNQRKLKALERVAACQAALQRAEQVLAEAQAAVGHHIAATLEREAKGHAEMIGKTLSHAEICNFHGELVVLAEQLAGLIALEKDAGGQRDTAQAELQAASAIFRERHRSVEKLQYLIREQNRKGQGKDLALAESADDEFRARPHLMGQGRGAFGLRTGDA